MPNYCVNELYIETTKEYAKFLLSGEGFSFEKILPVPEELKNTHTGYCKIGGQVVTVWQDGPDGKPALIEPETLARWGKEYGANNLYDWHILWWGVKWDASVVEVCKLPESLAEEVEDGEEGEVRDFCALRLIFQTPWDYPEGVIDALAEKCSHVRLCYYEMGMQFKGGVVYQDGEEVASWRNSYYGNLGG